MAETAFRTKPYLLPAAIVASIVLCGLIAWMIESRAAILRDGEEIVLRTAPIDPRDLLRGRYVRLDYAASLIEGEALEPLKTEVGRRRLRHVDVYVQFEEGADGFHRPVSVSLDRPAVGPFIRARARYVDRSSISVRVDYGIDRFYTNEHRAPELERRMREGELTEIVVAVAPDGTAQIKALRQAGETIVTEPLY